MPQSIHWHWIKGLVLPRGLTILMGCSTSQEGRLTARDKRGACGNVSQGNRTEAHRETRGVALSPYPHQVGTPYVYRNTYEISG